MSGDIWTATSRFLRSPAVKLVLLILLGLALAVPLLLVWTLVDERRSRAAGVGYEVGELWGGSQSITGPVLAVPYSVRIVSKVDDKTIEKTEERMAVFLPERLDVEGDARTDVLHRSIYDVTVYRSSLKLTGRFGPVSPRTFARDVAEIRWSDAMLALSISDVSGLEGASRLRIDGASETDFEPSLGISGTQLSGIHAAVGRNVPAFTGLSASAPAAAGFAFEASLVFKGSSELTFAPVARETTVKLASPWQHPSFFGAFLPAERNIDGTGFRADWSVPNLARSVPEGWSLSTEGGLERLMPYQFGVRFYVPVDFYNLTERSLKYGLLFIATAFMIVFVMELIAGRSVHPVQYLFLGVAMIFFFLLLLSLSEHTGFGPAYLAASAATGGMLSLYVGKSLNSAAKGLIMLAAFLVLYGLLYLVLTLEDYALLMGAIAGFVLLTATMFLTLRVDWSGVGRSA